jgi:hypothetical protein
MHGARPESNQITNLEHPPARKQYAQYHPGSMGINKTPLLSCGDETQFKNSTLFSSKVDEASFRKSPLMPRTQ